MIFVVAFKLTEYLFITLLSVIQLVFLFILNQIEDNLIIFVS